MAYGGRNGRCRGRRRRCVAMIITGSDFELGFGLVWSGDDGGIYHNFDCSDYNSYYSPHHYHHYDNMIYGLSGLLLLQLHTFFPSIIIIDSLPPFSKYFHPSYFMLYSFICFSWKGRWGGFQSIQRNFSSGNFHLASSSSRKHSLMMSGARPTTHTWNIFKVWHTFTTIMHRFIWRNESSRMSYLRMSLHLGSIVEKKIVYFSWCLVTLLFIVQSAIIDYLWWWFGCKMIQWSNSKLQDSW